MYIEVLSCNTLFNLVCYLEKNYLIHKLRHSVKLKNANQITNVNDHLGFDE